ncbi:MAG: xylulokinase [bacterium]
MSILGIDLGTQSVKVATVATGDHGARVLESATRAYPVESPHAGWAESDPAAWLAATLEAAREVLGRLQEPPRAIGLSGQMHGVVLCGDDGEPLRRAITWADLRSSAQARRISAELGPQGLARLGSAAFPGFAGPTLAWLADEEPAVLSSARWALQPKDWLRFALGGAVATDPSDASGTLLYDVVDGEWSPAALEACRVDPALLAPIVASQAVGGTVGAVGGALAGLPIAVGGADAACGNLGLGLAAGRGSIALGTGAQIASVLAVPAPDASLRTHTFASAGAAGDSWYRLGAVQSAGLAIQRVVSWLGADIAEMQASLAQGIRRDDPLFLPFVAGERSPYVAPELRGAWHGLSLGTSREAMLRSVLEGMAYVVSAAYEAVCDSGAVPEPPVTMLGGGSRDPAFVDFLATALGVPLRPAEVGDATVVGAARLGAAMAGMDLPPVVAREHATVDPREDALTEERQRRWRALVESSLRDAQAGEGSGT